MIPRHVVPPHTAKIFTCSQTIKPDLLTANFKPVYFSFHGTEDLWITLHHYQSILGIQSRFNLPRELCNMADQTINGVLLTASIQSYDPSEEKKKKTNLYFALRWGRAHRMPADNKGQIILSSFAGPHWPAFTLQYTEREQLFMPTAIHSFYQLCKTHTAVIWYTNKSVHHAFSFTS